MQKFDIFAVSIPDQKARNAVAQIVSSQSYVPLQTAMEKTNNPPVLLFHSIELEGAGQHINELKALGVGFRVERLLDVPEGADAGAGAGLGGDIDGGGAQPNLSDILTPEDTTEAPPAAPPPPPPPPPPPRSPAAPARPYHREGAEDGVRIGGIGLDTIRKSEAEKKKKSAMITAVAVAVIVVVTLLVAFLPKKYSFSQNTAPVSVARPGAGGKGSEGGKARSEKPKKRDGKRAAADNDAVAGAVDQGAAGAASGVGSPAGKQRRVVSGTHKQQANTYVDSAKSRGVNLEQSAALYSIAVSFNPYNAQAWHGLVQAYRGMGKFEEASKAEAQMREIFGEGVNSVNEAVGQFGELSDAYMSDHETYRVEYRSKKGTREEVLREVFNMTRAVRNACRCTKVSIHAYTPAAKEMIVHSTEAASIHSMTEFAKKAEILWLD